MKQRQIFSSSKVLKVALALNTLSLFIALSVYAYVGTFSRYLADDYCHHGLLETYGFFQAAKIHYLTFSNRYMILVVPYLTDFFGVRGTSYLPALTLVFWLLALLWLFREIFHAMQFSQTPRFSLFLSALLAFLTILQAPNRYQSIYWEASAINRFFPLMLTTFLAAATLFALRRGDSSAPPILQEMSFFFAAFLIGGFDEMNDALIFAASFLALAATFFQKTNRAHNTRRVLGSIFLGAAMSMGAMSFSPGIGRRVTHPPSALVFLQRIFTYPLDFLVDSLRTLPLPSALTFLVAAAAFFLAARSAPRKEDLPSSKILLPATLSPLILYGLLLVNFAPSAYAQAYPADRALLGARALTSALLMLEGACLGVFLARVSRPLFWDIAAAFFLALFALYPLRAAWQTTQTIPYYQGRAAAWDARDAAIRMAVSHGETNLIVPLFDSLHGIKELDENPNHWVNRCAARYYGVESIQGTISSNDP